MSTVPIAQSEAINAGLLSAKMMMEREKLLWWSNFTAKTLRDPKTGEPRAPVSPIVRHKEFVTQGQNHMRIPVLRDLTGNVYYGDAIVTGKGEKQRFDYIHAYCNLLQFPLEGPAIMSNQKVKGLQLIKHAMPQLSKRMAQQIDIEIAYTFINNYSLNITTAAASGGLAITARYHPNWYVAGSGPVTWSGTVQTHANNLGAAFAGLSDTTSDHFTVDNLENLRAEVQKIPLQPMRVPGTDKACYILLVHHNQMLQLRQDPKWRDSNNLGFIRGLKNPVFAAAEAYIANFMIFEREYSVLGVDEGAPSGGDYTLTFGPTSQNPLANGVDTYNKKNAIIFGNGALSEAVGSNIFFGKDSQNIEAFEEHAIRQICGFTLNTFYDVDAGASTPTTGVNQGSAIFTTFSPDPWS